MKSDRKKALLLPLLLLVLVSVPILAGWEVRRETVGEGIPTWMAVVRSHDSRLLFWAEYPTDQSCAPVVILKSDGWEAFAFDPSKIEPIATVIRFSRERLLQVPGYAGNGFIFEWEMEMEHFRELLAGFAEEKEFLVSLPGREGEVAGTFSLAGATKAMREACAACEKAYLAENDFIFSDSSERTLTKADVGRLSPNLLRIARNEIFARHGQIFKDPLLDRHFRSKKWYKPGGPRWELSPIEKSNIALIASGEG